MIQNVKVPVTLKPTESCATEVAYAVMERANPHSSTLVDEKLEKAGITVEALKKYFMQIAAVVCEFWANTDDPRSELTLKPHEIRNLYLPLIYGVIFAGLGNIKIGNYEFVLTPSATDVDREFLLSFSAELEGMRCYIEGDIGQIGNRSALPNDSTMSAIFLQESEDGRSAEMGIKDGVTYDERLAGMGALTGISLVNEAYRILYTRIEEANFRGVTRQIIDKGFVNSTKPES